MGESEGLLAERPQDSVGEVRRGGQQQLRAVPLFQQGLMHQTSIFRTIEVVIFSLPPS